MGDQGRHIKVVGAAGSTVKLGELATVQAFLASLVTRLGMRGLGELAFDVPLEVAKLTATPFEDEGGVTGVVVLSTSHCSIHTWPLRNHFVCDVYSCRDFAGSLIIEELEAAFGGLGQVRVSDLSASLLAPGVTPAQEVGTVFDPHNLWRWMNDREAFQAELAEANDTTLTDDERRARKDARLAAREAKERARAKP